jgi:2-polyprenyl-3-methyl-5-hydroxy-6-metoxy-1,4-benzoquinol methylase
MEVVPCKSGRFAMDIKTHWEKVYKTKAPDTVSWYLPHLETSLSLIARTGTDLSSSIIDVGGGESTLADDLVSRGYQNVTVLDISETAINVSKQRMGEAAEHVHWLVADVLAAELEPRNYEVWHDRAVFHFLTTNEQRLAYVRSAARSVRCGGHVIVSTFGPEGPQKCSGLEVMRYDADSRRCENRQTGMVRIDVEGEKKIPP